MTPLVAVWATVDPDTARARARAVLEADKYHEPRLPRPFKGVLEWLADVLRPVLNVVDRVGGEILEWILALPGGRFILLALVAGAAVALAWWLASRRSRSVVGAAEGFGLVDPAADPDQLEEEARRAEAEGDLALALRRTYEAGLLRLVRADRLVLLPQTTAEAAAAQVAHPTMDRLTATFQEVVFGERDVAQAELSEARQSWAGLLAAETVGAGVRG